MPEITSSMTGAKEIQDKMSQTARDLTGPPMMDGMRRATLLVSGAAKRLSPVDTGRLRSSITPEVRTTWRTVEGVVGSNVKYAAPQELGTKAYWPPLQALELWARRHGTTAYAVAKGIAARGIRAQRYLQGAVETNRGKIQALIEGTVTRIVEK